MLAARRRQSPASAARRQRLGERGGVARRDVEAGHAVLDQLGHAADAGADHRAAGGLRLEDDERRVLPPDRGHDDPVRLAPSAPAGRRGRRGRGAVPPARRRSTAAARRARSASADQVKPPCSVDARAWPPSRARRAAASSRTWTPLCGAMLPKKAKRSPRRGAVAGGPGGHAVRHHVDAVRGRGPRRRSGRAGTGSARRSGRRRRGPP